MNIETHQMIFESIQISQNECWYDSRQSESIQAKSKTYYITTHAFLNGDRVNRFRPVMNWFTQKSETFVSQFIFVWIDSCSKRKKFLNWYRVNQFIPVMNQFTQS